MALYDLSQAALLWTAVEGKVDSAKEHVCILPVLTLVKPIRVMNVLNLTTTSVAAEQCPPGTENLDTATPLK